MHIRLSVVVLALLCSYVTASHSAPIERLIKIKTSVQHRAGIPGVTVRLYRHNRAITIHLKRNMFVCQQWLVSKVNALTPRWRCS